MRVRKNLSSSKGCPIERYLFLLRFFMARPPYSSLHIGSILRDLHYTVMSPRIRWNRLLHMPLRNAVFFSHPSTPTPCLFTEGFLEGIKMCNFPIFNYILEVVGCSHVDLNVHNEFFKICTISLDFKSISQSLHFQITRLHYFRPKNVPRTVFLH